jgi:hypothetical protein
MPGPALAASLALALVASAPPAPPQKLPAQDAGARAAFQPGTPAGAEGFETGRLTSPEQSVAGPIVLTYLAPGAQVEVTSTAAGGAAYGRVTGPLAQPLHLPRGMAFRLPVPGDAVYAGYRPMPITRPLEAWVGRAIQVGVGAAPPESWVLRAIAGDHVTLERSRSFRVVPVRRISEIAWTDLTGIDPTPRLVLAPE